jgi:hypothetical protein
MSKETVLTEHLLEHTERDTRAEAIVRMVQRMGIGAKVKTNKAGDTVITIPKVGK